MLKITQGDQMKAYIVKMSAHNTSKKHPVLKVVLPEDRILLVRRGGRVFVRKLQEGEVYEEVVEIQLPHNAAACAEIAIQASGKLNEMLKSVSGK